MFKSRFQNKIFKFKKDILINALKVRISQMNMKKFNKEFLPRKRNNFWTISISDSKNK